MLSGGSAGTAGFPPQAVRDHAWGDLYADLYVAAVGVLVVAIGLTAFKRGERWVWFALLAVALAGTLTAVFDYLSWGGWYRFLIFGLPLFLAPALSVGHVSR